jgi:hypothetical protein
LPPCLFILSNWRTLAIKAHNLDDKFCIQTNAESQDKIIIDTINLESEDFNTNYDLEQILEKIELWSNKHDPSLKLVVKRSKSSGKITNEIDILNEVNHTNIINLRYNFSKQIDCVVTEKAD